MWAPFIVYKTMGDLRIGTIYPPSLFSGVAAISKVLCGSEQVWPSRRSDTIDVTVHFIAKGQSYDDVISVSKEFSTIVAPKASHIVLDGDRYYLYYPKINNMDLDRWHEWQKVDGISIYEESYAGEEYYRVTLWDGYVGNMLDHGMYNDEIWIYVGADTKEVMKLIINVNNGTDTQTVVATFNAISDTVVFNNPNITASKLTPYDEYDNGWEINGLAFSEYRKNSGKIKYLDTWLYSRMYIPTGDTLRLRVSDDGYQFYGPADNPYVMSITVSYDNLKLFTRHITIIDHEGFAGYGDLVDTVLFDADVAHGDEVKSSDGLRLASKYNENGDLILTYRYNYTNAKLLQGAPKIPQIPGPWKIESYRPGEDQANWYLFLPSWYDTITIPFSCFERRDSPEFAIEYLYVCKSDQMLSIYMDETYIVKDNVDVRHNAYNGYIMTNGEVNFHSTYPHSEFTVKRAVIDGKYMLRLTTFDEDWHVSQLSKDSGYRFPECIAEQHDDRHIDIDLTKITDFSTKIGFKVIAFKNYA